MPPRIPLLGLCARIRTRALPLVLLSAVPLAGQELPLQRDYPGSGPYQCAAPRVSESPSSEQTGRAGQFASEAVQAFVLGDLQRAEALYERAVEANPSDADLAYRHARVLEDLDRLDDALAEFCRSRGLATGSSDLEDIQERMDRLYEEVKARLPAAARNAFIAGLADADARRYQAAIDDFTLAVEAAPNWGAPIYNRALMKETLGLIGESLADYRLYIDIAPTAVDPVVVMVSERIGLLEAARTAETPSPAGALALGIVPGMGHYYTGRPLGGTVVLGLAGAAIATGLLVKDVTEYCLNDVPAGGTCPPDEVVDEVTKRPLLGVGLGVAAAVTVAGAVEALLRARARRARAEAAAPGARQAGLRLERPALSSRGSRIDVALLRLRFR